MFTWSRGGGWKGPYLTNELWCDLNVYVLSQWANAPNRMEKDIFQQYCTDVLKLSPRDSVQFRQICLLSADAVYRGIRSTHNDISPWWTRDEYMDAPPLPSSPDAVTRVLTEKDLAVQMWKQIVALANAIHIPNAATQEYLVTSCQYGLFLYQIYRDGFQLAALGLQGDKAKIKRLIDDYDQTWAQYRQLKADHPCCATLYTDKAFQDAPGMGHMVDQFRAAHAA